MILTAEGDRVKIVANDRPVDVPDGQTIGEFLASRNQDPRYVVVERNGEVVPRSEAAGTPLAEGDRLIVVRAVAGGAGERIGVPRGDDEQRSVAPSVGSIGTRRRRRLEASRLYVVTDARRERGDLEDFLDTICSAGVDIIQLRDKEASDDELLRAAMIFRRVADAHGALFILNDYPQLAVDAGADGVHVGQDDTSPQAARRVCGRHAIIGRSTHSVDQLDAAADEDVDYVAIGPVHATPTKPGRPATGLDPVRHAAATLTRPWFAIGGIDHQTLPAVVDAGAGRVVVVRAVTQAPAPADAVRALRAGLPSEPDH